MIIDVTINDTANDIANDIINVLNRINYETIALVTWYDHVYVYMLE